MWEKEVEEVRESENCGRRGVDRKGRKHVKGRKD